MKVTRAGIRGKDDGYRKVGNCWKQILIMIVLILDYKDEFKEKFDVCW